MRTRAPMALAVGVWLCTLPFVFLLLVPRLGVEVAGGTALAFLLVVTAICWSLCSVGNPHVLSNSGGER